MAPRDRRPQRRLAGIGVAAAPEQVEPGAEPLEDLRGRERLRARGRQLDRERERVEPPAQLGDLVGRVELRPLAEQRHRLGGGERRHRELDLAVDAQALAARDEDGEVRARGDERGQLGRRRDDLLEVVDEEQELALADVLGEAVAGAHGPGDRLADERRVAERGEADPDGAGAEVGDERGAGLERQAGLPGAAGAGQREEPRAAGDPREHRLELLLPADEGARRPREVRARERLERREGAVAQLEERDRRGDVLQPVLAELEERLGDEGGGRRGDEDLPAVAGGGDARGDVDVLAPRSPRPSRAACRCAVRCGR